jgi:hypothetical protein
MRAQRQNEAVVLSFSVPEAGLLSQVLDRLISTYRLKPDEVDPAVAAAWYSAKGCESARMSKAETREWLAQLHAMKGENMNRLAHWLQQLGESEDQSKPALLTLSFDEASAFMMAINDYRLMAAAHHNIGEQEMSILSPLTLARLPVARREALFEVHFLAWILEETLHALEGP